MEKIKYSAHMTKTERKQWGAEHCKIRTELIIKLLESVEKGRPLVGAEIGVWKGDLVWSLLKHSSRIEKMYAVDPFSIYHAYGKVVKGWEQEQWDGVYQRVRLKLKSEFANRVELIRKRSDECLHLLPPLHFMELDSDHSYEQVKKDITNLERKVVPGGLFCGHDYYGDRWVEGVKRAVDEYVAANGRELKTDVDTWMWWWYVS